MKKFKKSKVMFLAILSALGSSTFSSAVEKNKTTSDTMTDLMSSNKKTSTKNSHDSNFINKFNNKSSGLSKAQKISLAILLPVGAAIVVGGVVYVVKKVNSKKTLEPIHAMEKSIEKETAYETVDAGSELLKKKIKLKKAKDLLSAHGKFLRQNGLDAEFENSYLKTLLNKHFCGEKTYIHPSNADDDRSEAESCCFRDFEGVYNWKETRLDNGWSLFKGENDCENKSLILKDDLSQILFLNTKADSYTKMMLDVNLVTQPDLFLMDLAYGIYYIKE